MKQKQIIILLTALFMLSGQQMYAEIYSGTDGNISWNLDTETGVLMLSGCGDMKDYGLTNITGTTKYITSAPWGIHYLSIKEFDIQSGITSIGSYAFSGCNNVTEANLPSSVHNIQDYAFYECDSLTSVTIPEGVVSIGENAFRSCGSLINITIPSSVKNFGSWAFSDCINLTSVNMCEGVTDIGNSAFSGCTNLASVTIPSTVVNIMSCAFFGCISLESVMIPRGVLSIGDFAFHGCNSLTGVMIPEGVTSIKESTFNGCSSLESVSLPSSVINIGDYAFSNCSILSDVTIPEGVTTIGENAFFKCSSLTSISIPNSVSSIERSTFYGCSSLMNVTIPSCVTNIGENAFRSCSSLTSVTIPEGVTTIESGTFRGCSSLAGVTIPSTVSSIGSDSFYGCNGLTSINVANGNARYNSYNDCNAIIETNENKLIVGCMNTTIPSEVTSIGENAFVGCHGLTSLTLPPTIECIGNYAFSDCIGLTSMVIPTSVVNIGRNSFSGCTGLSNVTIPTSVAYIGTAAFLNCSSLMSVKIPSNITKVGNSVFSDCNNLKDLLISEGITSIEYKAFSGCQSLSNVKLPSSVTSIDSYAFSDCRGLTSVTMESSTPCTLGNSSVFPSSNEGFKIYVPKGSYDAYVSADGWSDFADYIVEMEHEDDADGIVKLTDISAMDYTLYFPSTEVNTGTTSTLSLNLKNAAEDITAIQCDIYLPEGVEWASTIDKRGNKVLTQPTFNAETERTDETYHTITPVTQMSNGAYRVMCYSMQKEVFLDNDGAVLDIPVTISEEMEDGDYSVVIKDIYLTDTKTNQYTVDEVISKLTVFSYTSGDVNADGLINITDIVSVISYILEDAPESFIFKAADVNEDGIINITDIVGIIDIILTDDAPANATLRRRVAALANALPSLTTLEIVPFGIEQGTTSATVTLDMLNPNDEFTAFECSIKLPEGIGWAYTTDRRGNIIYTQPTFNKAADRTDANYHTLSPVTKMSDGTYKVMCYSMQKIEFLDAAGAILDLPLIFAEDLAEGIYEIEVKDIVLTRKDVTDVKPSDYKAIVVVGKPAVKSATIYGDITADAIAMLNARLGANESLGSLDLSSAIAVDDATAITTANPNAVIYVAEEMSVKNESNVVEGDVCANLVLTDGKPFGPAKTFTVKAGEYSRTLSADTYGTIVLPFTPDAETLKGYTFYELTDVETNALTFDEVSNPVAGKPYIVTSDGTATKMSAEAESTVVIEPAATEADGWTMTGSYESVVFTDADELASLYCISGNQFKQATSKLTMNPFRAYFVGDGSVNSITLRGDDGTTNILNLEGEQAVGQLYDVLGRQVEHAEQGIYIQNGKKVLVK